MLSSLKSFFATHIIPELLTRRKELAEQKQPLENPVKLYCFCNSEYIDGGDEVWIGCDSVVCKWEWFHLSCVDLKRIPKGKWYCPVCRKAVKDDQQLT